MILAFLNPQTVSKTPPTSVRSGPWILEPSGPRRITLDKQGPVLHDSFQNHFASPAIPCCFNNHEDMTNIAFYDFLLTFILQLFHILYHKDRYFFL